MTEELKITDKRGAVVPAEKNPGSIIELAVSRGTDLVQLKEALELQERWEATQAKKAYVVAMSEFKVNPPKIEKDKHVKFKAGQGITEYHHASLANVTDKINIGLSLHGLSAAWTTTQTNGTISVTCKITHIRGHSEETVLTASPDLSGSKNAIQAIGSAISYLQRYTLLSLTGLATKEMDDDGNSAGAQFVDGKQLKTIVNFINEKNVDEGKLLEYMGVESLEKIPADKYKVAIVALRAAKGRKKVDREPGEDDT